MILLDVNCPHALTTCIIMASAAITVHALDGWDTNFLNFLSIELAGILCAPVSLSEWQMQPFMPGYNVYALFGVAAHSVAFMFVSIAKPKTLASKQSKMADTYSLPSLPLISVMSVMHFSKGFADLKLRFSLSLDSWAFLSAFVMPLGLRLGR